jgi:hypothetical protein
MLRLELQRGNVDNGFAAGIRGKFGATKKAKPKFDLFNQLTNLTN